jgi:hypothetical protein
MLTFSQVTIQDLIEKFGIIVENESFIPTLEASVIPEWLVTYLNINKPSPALAKSEKAVSEMLVAPILSAVKANNADKIALFSGEPLAESELSGICDFVIAANPKAYLPEPPIMVLVEAKKQDIYGGISQCIAEMIVAQRINKRLNIATDVVFGCVTTGTEWLFIKLSGNKAITEPTIYYFTDLANIISIFQWMIAVFLNSK